MNKINTNELSVVVQGPIWGTPADAPEVRYTKLVCESIRKHLPGAEIILSTWKDSNVEGIDYDILVENDDPGFYFVFVERVFKEPGKLVQLNTNRQIVSTVNGLNAATRPYGIKTRSDIVFTSDDCLTCWGIYNNSTPNQIVKDRIVTLPPGNYRRYPSSKKAIYGTCDWFFLGRVEDLLLFWDVPLINDKEFLKNNNEHALEKDIFCSEQHVYTHFLKKNRYYQNLYYKHTFDVNRKAVVLFEKSLAENFVFYDTVALGIESLKYPNKYYGFVDYRRMGLYTHDEWKKMYNKYCSGDAVVKTNSRDFWQAIICRTAKCALVILYNTPYMFKIYSKLKKNSHNTSK